MCKNGQGEARGAGEKKAYAGGGLKRTNERRRELPQQMA